MTDTLSRPCTAFAGGRVLSSGAAIDVALAVKNALEQGSTEAILTFDDATGRVMDFDLRGTEADVAARLREPEMSTSRQPLQNGIAAVPAEPEPERRRGRPKLGVVAREVTLLPRHWEWLAAQPGGASVALRRLVEAARRDGGEKRSKREAHEAAYRFMSALAGDLAGFEEAIRALFADDRSGFEERIVAWPRDIRDHATRLAFGGSTPRLPS